MADREQVSGEAEVEEMRRALNCALIDAGYGLTVTDHLVGRLLHHLRASRQERPPETSAVEAARRLLVDPSEPESVHDLARRVVREAGSLPADREQPQGPVPDAEYDGTCDRCGSDRWVSVSFTGGLRRVPQCVPCGRVHPGVRLGELASREQPAGLRELVEAAEKFIRHRGVTPKEWDDLEAAVRAGREALAAALPEGRE